MTSQHSPTEARLSAILAYLNPAASTLNDIATSIGIPFMQAIASTTVSLVTSVQNVKQNRDECVHLVESIQQIITAIIDLHINAEAGSELALQTLHNLGKFTETIHQIYSYVEAQRHGNRLKQLLRQREMNQLLKHCKAGLGQAFDNFKYPKHYMQRKAHEQHVALLESITTLSDGGSSDKSSVIFHGRERELEEIVQTLVQDAQRIAILGAGGMGKTTLAKTAFHHPAITAKYGNRFFVPCNTARTKVELVAVIGSYLGLKPGKDLTKAVIRYFTLGPPSLIVLDNLESPWEAMSSRDDVEEFLSLLTDVQHLALVDAKITMRGTERPAKVKWSRPFLAPLKSIPDQAARQLFFEIADEVHDPEKVDRVLGLTDNVPLAIELIAHLVEYEGCSNVLARWETERIGLLSNGFDSRSNLEISIGISLSSPRMASCPGAWDLLSLLSILPDGISDVELQQTRIPIPNILACRAALLRTSLAYASDDRRLNLLGPIREYIQQTYPPPQTLVGPLGRYFHELLELYLAYDGVELHGVVDQIAANLHNIQEIARRTLYSSNPDLAGVIKCILALNSFVRMTGHGAKTLMDCIPNVLQESPNPLLETMFITERFGSWRHNAIANPDTLLQQGLDHLRGLNDKSLEGYCLYHTNDVKKAGEYYETALSTSRSFGDINRQCTTLVQLALLKIQMGNYPQALAYSEEIRHLAKLSGNLFQEARALRIQSTALTALGNYKECAGLLGAAKELLCLCGLSQSTTFQGVMSSEATCHLAKSEYAEALGIHQEIARKQSAEQDPHVHAFALLNIAQIEVTIGTPECEVRQKLAKVAMLFGAIKYPIGVVLCGTVEADLELRSGNFVEARKLFQKCLTRTWGRYTEAVSYCLERVADTERWTAADLDWSSAKAVVLLAHGLKTSDRPVIHKALRYIGDIFLKQGDDETSRNLVTVALIGFTQMDIHQSRAECMLRLGNILKRKGDLEQAVGLWKKAQLLFSRSLQVEQVAHIHALVASAEKELFNGHAKGISIGIPAGGTPDALTAVQIPVAEMN
ncbi:hypothetical protein GGX14DRAFT_401014 [Mycena pura]|uniref:NB-ARC domain-containing protein n=1 Tax=Mycena pura TaxID=153505 RepID=A0AAD6V5G0_9AGAR|nr:hypothetical protein GGX14DRAFT_401014 [Mycena pura]